MFKISPINTTDVRVTLQAMPGALLNKAMKPMVEKISSVGAKRMKANWKRVKRRTRKTDRWRPTGAMLASIGVKSPVKLMKSGTAMFGGFGIRRNEAFIGNKLKAVRRRLEKKTTWGFHKDLKPGSVQLAERGNRNKSDVLRVRPSKYAHLVERGHGGPIRSKPYPFASPTAVEMESVVKYMGPQILRANFPKVIAAERRRLSRRLGSTIRSNLRRL